jgi:hypothetical protein
MMTFKYIFFHIYSQQHIFIRYTSTIPTTIITNSKQLHPNTIPLASLFVAPCTSFTLIVGAREGLLLLIFVGFVVGLDPVGVCDGDVDGDVDGECDGCLDGDWEGFDVEGECDGLRLGEVDGLLVDGAILGDLDGCLLGTREGERLGTFDGDLDGARDGFDDDGVNDGV